MVNEKTCCIAFDDSMPLVSMVACTALQRAIPVMEQSRSALRALAAVFASEDAFVYSSMMHVRCHQTGAPGSCSSQFKQHRDDTKYGAESALPHMLAHSPYVTSDWRRANAVLLFSVIAGGPLWA